MKSVKEIVFLDGDEIKTEFDFHKKIGNIFKGEDFINGYGYNLDALWDIATSGAGLNLELHWQGAEESRRNLGDEYFYKIINVLERIEDYQKKQCITYEHHKNNIPFKFYLE
jgi:ribonuclease inhibitor